MKYDIPISSITRDKMYYTEIGGSYQLKENFKILLPFHPYLHSKKRKQEYIKHGHYLTLSSSGTLYMDKGYVSNGADYAIDTTSLIHAFFVHDALLYIIGAGKLNWEEWKPYTDALFTAISKKDGVPWWRRWYQSRAVRRLGRKEGSIGLVTKIAP